MRLKIDAEAIEKHVFARSRRRRGNPQPMQCPALLGRKAAFFTLLNDHLQPLSFCNGNFDRSGHQNYSFFIWYFSLFGVAFSVA